MKKTNKRTIIVALIVLLLALAVGYAAFTDQLKISGTAGANGTFDLQFVSGSCVEGEGINKEGSTVTLAETNNKANVIVKDLAYPGAGGKFTVKVKNMGTIPAKIKSIRTTGVTDPDIKVTFPEITTSHPTISANGECDITFIVKWDTASKLDTSKQEKQLKFSMELDYEQDITAFDGAAAHTDGV